MPLILTFVSITVIVLFVYWRGRDKFVSVLKSELDGYQKNILSSQKEFERNVELRSSVLRSELSNELLINRKELHEGLLHGTQSLEQKMSHMDMRLEQKLSSLNQGVQEKLEKNIKEGFLHFDKVTEHLKRASLELQSLNTVGESIHDLKNLLRLPHLRGEFGEATLERLLSDFLPKHLYELQASVVPGSQERVDAIVKFPQGVLPIDSKFPREQVIALFEDDDPAKIEEAQKKLGEAIKILAKSIREKYIHPEHGTTEMALLFLPSETLYFEVIKNPKLCEELNRQKVFPCSPNTLMVMLQAVSMAQNYYEMAKGVEMTLSEIKKAERHYEHFHARFEVLGKNLKKAQDSFDMASTHLTRWNNATHRLTLSNDEIMEPKELKESIDTPLEQ